MKTLITTVLLTVAAVTSGCGIMKNTPYASAQTPRVSSLAGTMEMGAIGEFEYTSSYVQTADGTTSQTIRVKGSKEAIGMFGSGVLGFLGGLVMP